jgi:acyl-CoA synthetase (AMP-forming)/AMP-acid ligase II
MTAWTSLPHLLRHQARQHGGREALRFQGTSLTVAELDAAVSRWASVIIDLGVEGGDRVALCLPNGLDVVAAWLGAAAAHAVVVPLNYTCQLSDLRHALVDSGARLVVTNPQRVSDFLQVQPNCPELRTIAINHDPAPAGAVSLSARLAGASPDFELPALEPGELVTLQYTSGTTGFPKGCMLTHEYWLQLAQGAVEYGPLTDQDVILTAGPFYYMDAMWNLLAGLIAGAALVMLPRFSASTFWRTVRDEGVTFLYCLGTMPVLLLKQPSDGVLERGHQVRFVLCSGIVPQLHQIFESRWGCPWREAYGTTEVGAGLMVPLADEDSVGSGALGAPFASREARVVDPATGVALNGTATGELQLRGPAMMLGYWRNPEATAAYFQDSWARTGDLVRRDERGYYHLVGRLKDMIRRGGENIAAMEVEATLCEHPAVRAAACVAIPDPDRGEEVKAFIQLVQGTAPEQAPPETLLDFVRARLAPFKVPRFLEYVDHFPLTPSERIAKHQLLAGRADQRAGSWDASRRNWIPLNA